MRSGKELLIASSQYAHEVRWRSWLHLWSALCLLAALVTLSCLQLPWFVCIPVSVVTGLVMVRLFIVYHDYLHGAVLQRSRIASVIMHLYGLLLLSPPSIWKHAHDDHHKNNAKKLGSTLGTYPVMTRQDYASASFGEKLDYVVQRHPITMALGYVTIFLWELCLRSFLVNPKKHFDGLLAPLLHVSACIALYTISWQAMLLGMIVPMAIASSLGCYLFYAQHNFPKVKRRHDEAWDYVYAALHSSSYMKMSPLMSWFTGNIGYHHVHHLNARIPFYRLPEAMAGIEELQCPTYTTLRPADIWTCLQLNLWDSEADRFMSYREAAQFSESA